MLPWPVSADDIIQVLSRDHFCRAKRGKGDVGKEVQTCRKFHFLAFDCISPSYCLGNVLYLPNSRKTLEDFIIFIETEQVASNFSLSCQFSLSK